MFENTEPWEDGVPADLLPAIHPLRESFDEEHWASGETTKRICYAWLHNTAAEDPAREYAHYLERMKVYQGTAATVEFSRLLKQHTLPATFKACFDFYLGGVSLAAIRVYRELVEIGRANQERLTIAYSDWAEGQAQHLIRSYTYRIRSWVREVCDTQVNDPSEDFEEQVFWRKWQAPTFVAMRPSGLRTYDAEGVWERADVETSLRWIDVFADEYVFVLEARVKKVKGEIALEMAKKPKPPAEAPPLPETQAKSSRTTSHKREVRKLQTQEEYRRWQKEYRALKKERPGKTDTWYSQQIAKTMVGAGHAPETIRKHMVR